MPPFVKGLAQTCLNDASYFIPVSKPSSPVKSGVPSNNFIIFSCTIEGSFGGGPPPVWRCCLRISENFFLAELVKFFHFSLTSCEVLFAPPTAFISLVISSQILFYLWFVTEFVNLDCKTSKFSSTLLVNIFISDTVKLSFLLFLCFSKETSAILKK